MNINFTEIFSVTLILFSIIDILGAIPIVIDLKKKAGVIHAERTTIVAGGLMIGYLYLGKSILSLLGVDVKSFAMAGAIILFLIAFEMISGRQIFQHNTADSKATSIVPLAFPIIAGAGTMTTILSLKAAYDEINIIIGIIANLVIIFIVLKSTNWLERKMSITAAAVLQKVFGLILLAIAIKLIKTNLI